MNNRAEALRHMSLIIGIVVLAGGIVPLLADFGIIAELPVVPTIVFHVLLVVAGLLLLIDATMGGMM